MHVRSVELLQVSASGAAYKRRARSVFSYMVQVQYALTRRCFTRDMRFCLKTSLKPDCFITLIQQLLNRYGVSIIYHNHLSVFYESSMEVATVMEVVLRK
jgi:hypothetical protein